MSELTLANKRQTNLNITNIQTSDLLLVFLYAKGKCLGFTRLDKILYLLKQTKEFNKNIVCEWLEENYGPFSPELYDTLQALIICGAIKVSHEQKPRNLLDVADEVAVEREVSDITWRDWKLYPLQAYRLSEKIVEYAKQRFSELSQKQQDRLTRFKIKYGSMKLAALFHLVYLQQRKEASS